MAKAPRTKTGARKPNDEDAASTLLDAAFCIDVRRRRELVQRALAGDAALQRWAEHWAAGNDDPRTAGRVANADANLDARVAERLADFLLALSAEPANNSSDAGQLPLNEAWRTRLAAVARQFAQQDADQRSFDDALAAAKVDALKEFAYGAGHEINNPLANISARAQTLLRDETAAERRRMLATINRQAMRAHEMIADLMLFARPPQLVVSQLDAAAVVRRVVEELSAMAAAQATRLACGVGETPLPVTVDAAQLGVAVKSVVRNAIEAVAAGGNVDVDARIVSAAALNSAATEERPGEFRRQLGRRIPSQSRGQIPKQVPSRTNADGLVEQMVEITVVDDGPGFTPREQAHLFDPFFSGREAGRGLGFGLCVAWRIVTDHGGQIAVMSEPGRGTTIVMTLPASAVEDSLPVEA